MNTDAQIREILARSFPVNDNCHKTTQVTDDCKAATNSGIYVVGNNNIVISSGLFVTAAAFLFISICLLLQH